MIVASALERRRRENLAGGTEKSSYFHLVSHSFLSASFSEVVNFPYQLLPRDEFAHRVALDALRAKIVQLDGLPEEGQAGLVSQHVLDLDISLALLTELWPMPSYNGKVRYGPSFMGWVDYYNFECSTMLLA